MNCGLRVANPPLRTTILYDGECPLCRSWVDRWQRVTGNTVEYVPVQDEQVSADYPELPRKNLLKAIHLIEPDGTVHCGADAVVRTLRSRPGGQLLHWAYERVPLARPIAAAAYRFVSRTRHLWPGPRQHGK